MGIRCFSKKVLFGRTQGTSNKVVTDRLRLLLLTDSRFRETLVASRIQVNFGNSHSSKTSHLNQEKEFTSDMVALLKRGTDIHNWRHVEQLACRRVNRLSFDELLLIADIFYQVPIACRSLVALRSASLNYRHPGISEPFSTPFSFKP